MIFAKKSSTLEHPDHSVLDLLGDVGEKAVF